MQLSPASTLHVLHWDTPSHTCPGRHEAVVGVHSSPAGALHALSSHLCPGRHEALVDVHSSPAGALHVLFLHLCPPRHEALAGVHSSPAGALHVLSSHVCPSRHEAVCVCVRVFFGAHLDMKLVYFLLGPAVFFFKSLSRYLRQPHETPKVYNAEHPVYTSAKKVIT